MTATTPRAAAHSRPGPDGGAKDRPVPDAVTSEDTGGVDGLMTAVAALSRTATGQVAVDVLLRQLVDAAAQHLPVDGAGAMACDGGGGLVFVHGSTTGIDLVERLQELMQQGPCRDSVDGLREVAVSDLEQDGQPDRWQSYVAGARQVGLRSVVALPLVSRGRGWGVLDLYREHAGPWREPDLAAARLLADVAVSYVVMAVDRDQARQVEQELAHRSLHDELTGLPNRALLFDRLGHALKAAARHQKTVAVFFIDLDRFKQINDTFGHAGGDAVLVQTATRLRQVLRQEDTLARLAGDELVLVCEQLPQHADGELTTHLRAIGGRISAALAEPIRVGGVDLVVSASVGVALSHPASTPDDLLAEADAAMYRVKQHRHDEIVIRDHARTITLPRTRHLDRELARALPQGQLRVHYQPIVSADDGTLRAVEALLRWQHPDLGLLPAAEFIDVAERTGLIVGMGRWLLDTVCGQLRAWLDQLGDRTPAVAYVNLSARELTDPTLPDAVRSALDRHRLRPQQLGLELLETSVIDPQLVEALQHYDACGHPLSVDDFGTGYSSLSRLIQLPVSIAKIDRSFAAAVHSDPRSRALVDAVLVVAAKLGLQVIGEGVENAEQAQMLRDAGCPLLQGHHLGVPQEADSLTRAWAAGEPVATR